MRFNWSRQLRINLSRLLNSPWNCDNTAPLNHSQGHLFDAPIDYRLLSFALLTDLTPNLDYAGNCAFRIILVNMDVWWKFLCIPTAQCSDWTPLFNGTALGQPFVPNDIQLECISLALCSNLSWIWEIRGYFRHEEYADSGSSFNLLNLESE